MDDFSKKSLSASNIVITEFLNRYTSRKANFLQQKPLSVIYRSKYDRITMGVGTMFSKGDNSGFFLGGQRIFSKGGQPW